MKKETILSKYVQDYNHYRYLYEMATADTSRLSLTCARCISLAHANPTKGNIHRQRTHISLRFNNMKKRHGKLYIELLENIAKLSIVAINSIGKDDNAVYSAYKSLIKSVDKDIKHKVVRV